jgi:hypothetical protein
LGVSRAIIDVLLTEAVVEPSSSDASEVEMEGYVREKPVTMFAHRRSQ